MAGEVAIRNLYDAAITGDIRRFVELIEADPYLPLEASYACSRNILHIATMHGHAAIVEEVINRNPRLARDLDSERSSPLHTAAAGVHEEIAAALLRVAPATCWWRDCHGMNPVHIAAINGHVETLRELIAVDRFPAMERLHRGQNVLHLCLKHGKFNAFIFLVDKLKDLVYVEDDDGETILHAAIRLRKVDFVEHLVRNHNTYELPKNSKGKTVHQISQEGAPLARIDEILSQRISYSSRTGVFRGKVSDIAMVVVVLIATMAFQASVSPPGGVWQDDDNSSSPHRAAGEAVMASTRPKLFKHFRGANNIAFFSSIVTIALLTTGMPSTNVFFMMIAMCTMWASLASISISYVSSMIVITPNTHKEEGTIPPFIHIIGFVFLAAYAVFCVSSLVTFASRIRVYKMARRWRQQRAVEPQTWFAWFCSFFISLHAFCFHG